MKICFLTKTKNRKLAKKRQSLHFYTMIFWWKKGSLQFSDVDLNTGQICPAFWPWHKTGYKKVRYSDPRCGKYFLLIFYCQYRRSDFNYSAWGSVHLAKSSSFFSWCDNWLGSTRQGNLAQWPHLQRAIAYLAILIKYAC